MGRTLDRYLRFGYSSETKKKDAICLEAWFILGNHDDYKCSDPRWIRNTDTWLDASLSSNIHVSSAWFNCSY